MEAAPFVRRCPFCGTQTTQPRCETCQRDPSAPRRVCAHCQKQTPTAEKACMHCRGAAGSELAWKVPLIVILFVVAFAVAIALQTIR